MRKLRFRVLHDLSKVTNGVRVGFQGQIMLTPQNITSVTTALQCLKQVFPAMTRDDSVRIWKKIHDPCGGGMGTAAAYGGIHCTSYYTICYGRTLNRMCRVPSSIPASAWDRVLLSVSQQSRTNTRPTSSYWPWVGRHFTGILWFRRTQGMFSSQPFYRLGNWV